MFIRPVLPKVSYSPLRHSGLKIEKIIGDEFLYFAGKRGIKPMPKEETANFKNRRIRGGRNRQLEKITHLKSQAQILNIAFIDEIIQGAENHAVPRANGFETEEDLKSEEKVSKRNGTPGKKNKRSAALNKIAQRLEVAKRTAVITALERAIETARNPNLDPSLGITEGLFNNSLRCDVIPQQDHDLNPFADAFKCSTRSDEETDNPDVRDSYWDGLSNFSFSALPEGQN